MTKKEYERMKAHFTKINKRNEEIDFWVDVIKAFKEYPLSEALERFDESLDNLFSSEAFLAIQKYIRTMRPTPKQTKSPYSSPVVTDFQEFNGIKKPPSECKCKNISKEDFKISKEKECEEIKKETKKERFPNVSLTEFLVNYKRKSKEKERAFFDILNQIKKTEKESPEDKDYLNKLKSLFFEKFCEWMEPQHTNLKTQEKKEDFKK